MQKRKYRWGERRQKIAAAILLVVKKRLRENTSLLVSLPTLELMREAKKMLPSNLVLTSLDVINAVRRDQALGSEMSLAQHNGVEFITLHSEEMRLGLEIVRTKVERLRRVA